MSSEMFVEAREFAHEIVEAAAGRGQFAQRETTPARSTTSPRRAAPDARDRRAWKMFG
jgi:hypothetical protein